jgi:hypothetical protein
MSDLVKIPEEVKDLLWEDKNIVVPGNHNHGVIEAFNRGIAQKDAEIERLKHEWADCEDRLGGFIRLAGHAAKERDEAKATVETLKGLLRGWQIVCRAVQIGAEIPRTIEDLSLRTDQQLQPKQELK